MYLALKSPVRLPSRTAGRACVRVVCSCDWRGAWLLTAASRRRCSSASLRLGRFARFSLIHTRWQTWPRVRGVSCRGNLLDHLFCFCLPFIVTNTHSLFFRVRRFLYFLPLTWLVRRQYIGRRRKYELDDALRVAR